MSQDSLTKRKFSSGIILLLAFMLCFSTVHAANLAAQMDYTLSPGPSTSYPDSGKELTNGYYAASDPADSNWVGFDQDSPQITFAFSNLSRIDSVKIHFLNYTSWGINLPTSVETLVSLDNIDWVSKGVMAQDGSSFILNLTGTNATYLRLVITRNYWAFVDEVEVHGEYVGQFTPLENETINATKLSSQMNYAVSPMPSSSYPDSGNELTNGLYAASDPTGPNWVGFDQVAPNITFAFSNISRIDLVKIHFLDYPNWSITFPTSVEVRVSEDGASWVSKGLMAQNGNYFILNLTGTNTTALQLEILVSKVLSDWTFVDEIEIYGEYNQSAPPGNQTNQTNQTTNSTKISLQMDYLLLPAPSALYNDSGNDLTNGAYAAFNLADPDWVGFDQDSPQITFAFSNLSRIDSVKIHFMNYTGGGINLPTSVELQVSQDNLNWLGKGLMAQNGEYFILNLSGTNTTVASLAMRINRNLWVFADEIEIYGEDTGLPLPKPPILAFVAQTEDNATTLSKNWAQLNISLNETNPDTFIVNWLSPSGNAANIVLYDRDGPYARELSISNSGNVITDYPVKLVFNSSTVNDAASFFLKANSTNLRFYAGVIAGNNLSSAIPYWVESWNATANQAIVWIKVPYILAAANTTVNMYYGGSGVSMGSGEKTFAFFDDFDDGYTGDWVLSTSCVRGVKTATTAYSTSKPYSLMNYVTGACGASYSYSLRNFTATTASTYRINFYTKSQACTGCTIYSRLFVDGTQVFSQSITGAMAARNVSRSLTAGSHELKIGMYTTTSSSGTFPAYFDNIIVQKYVTPEPTAKIGSETNVSSFYLRIENLSDGTYAYYGWCNDTSGSSAYTINYTSTSPRYLSVKTNYQLRTVLLITTNKSFDDESYSRAANTLDGMGIVFDSIEDSQIYATNLTNYQLVLVAGSTMKAMSMNLSTEQKIIDSINNGVNYLWIGDGIWGSFQTTDLPQAFGIIYTSEDISRNLNITQANFTNLANASDRLAVLDEYIRIVTPNGSTVDGYYLTNTTNTSIPFITTYQKSPTTGKTVYISLPILEWWKDTEANYTYARNEVLTKYIRQLLTEGYVSKNPAKNGKDAVFIIRLEDYTPGGSEMGHDETAWMTRMSKLVNYTKTQGVPLNIAIIPVYSYPYGNETLYWNSTNTSIVQLKSYAVQARTNNGTLIVHGYKHQNGNGVDDYSGDDWENWNEDTQTFLSLAEQQNITTNAYNEAKKQFNYTPTTWETPHYISNKDTYLAAFNSNFTYFTESDTKLFPNYNGYQNLAQGLLLNVPETGFDFAEDAANITLKEPTKKIILSRTVRINGLYYVFYHNNIDQQYTSLQNMVTASKTYSMWYPSVEEYAKFWNDRDNATISSSIDKSKKKITANIANSFQGLTISVRMPDNTSLVNATVNGVLTATTTKTAGGVSRIYVIMPAGQNMALVVNYR